MKGVGLVAIVLRISFLIISGVATLEAMDLGVHGHTFPIIEKDLLQLIKQWADNLNQEEWQELIGGHQDRLIEQAQEPIPVDELDESIEYCCFEYDPTITLAADIKGGDNRILFPKGTSVNPLTIVSLEGEILFFDSTREEHIEWAKEANPSATWVLVKGRPLDLAEEENHEVYFDQMGTLSRQLRIQHVPARVSQKGLKLLVEEIPVEEGRE